MRCVGYRRNKASLTTLHPLANTRTSSADLTSRLGAFCYLFSRGARPQMYLISVFYENPNIEFEYAFYKVPFCFVFFKTIGLADPRILTPKILPKRRRSCRFWPRNIARDFTASSSGLSCDGSIFLFKLTLLIATLNHLQRKCASLFRRTRCVQFQGGLAHQL